MKIIKIQQHYKLRILRKKLAAIVIPDDEDDHAEDLLDFFNKENKETDEVKFDDEDLDKKIEEIGKKIEKNIEKNKNKNKSKNYVLEVIKEEKERDLDTQAGINLDKIPDLNISDDDIKDINEIISEDLLMNNNKDNKDINNKKEIEIKEESLKSMEKNVKPINNYMHIENKNEKGRNIDIINFNNNMTQEGETIKEITRNDLKHSPNIGVKISQKIIKIPTYKNNELIFNVNNSPSKFLFATNKNSNLETKTKIKKSDNNKRDSFKNINIQIDRQSVEIKGGNLILNDKRDNQNEENIKIKEYFHIIEQK
jgi:hypothetical protein